MIVQSQGIQERSGEATGKPLNTAINEESNATNRIKLPIKTWIARPLPEPGKGPCPIGGCKHMRLAHNPVNGRIYFLGGDYSAKGDGSGVNGVWSYSIAAGAWVAEYPYCGKAGEIMPGRPDEVGWTFDTRRKVFWLLPGFFGLFSWGPGACGSGSNVATQVTSILNFDPSTKKWSNPGVASEPVQRGAESGKFAVYDPITDSIYRVYYSGGGGIIWTVFDISKNRWSEFYTPNARDGSYINDAHLDKEYLAADIASRYIYVIDPNHYRLLRVHMDKRFAEIMPPIPAVDPNRPSTLQDITSLFFDPNNRVVLYPYYANLAGFPRLLIYHPDTNQWEIDAMHQSNGMKVRGNSGVFDPQQNTLVMIGGVHPTSSGSDPTLTHLFLYRYGEGRNGAAKQ